MNITQEKLLLVYQIQANSKQALCSELKTLNQKKVDAFTHEFIQDMMRFFEKRTDDFYQEVKRYDVLDFALYVDYMEMDGGSE